MTFLIAGIGAIIIGIAVFALSVYAKKGYSSKKERCTATVEGTLVKFAKEEYSRRDDNTNYVDILLPYLRVSC